MSVSSCASMMSAMSVNFRGEEVELEKAVDSVFRDLQDNLNGTHCTMRSILQADEQDADYSDVLQMCLEIHTNIDAMNVLFKELQAVLKQVSKPQDDEEKEMYKAAMAAFKADKKKS